MSAVPETEAEFQAAVVELARLLGWTVNHTRRSIGGRKRGWTTATTLIGMPDLLMWHDRHGWAAFELKVGRNKPTPEQVNVLASMTRAGCRAMVAYPSDWDAVEAILRGSPNGG